MKELFARYGLTQSNARLIPPQVAPPMSAAERLSSPYVVHLSNFNKYTTRKTKRSVEQLKLFSESALPSRAITLIRDLITQLDYDIKPKSKKNELDDAVVMRIQSVFDNPNASDNDLQSFLGPVIEDILVFDAGCWENVESPDFIQGNDLLGLEVISGYTMKQNLQWKGNPLENRWRQEVIGFVGNSPEFLDWQIEYVMHRKRSWNPFGLSCLETACEIMDAWLNVSTYQKDIASNAYPAFMFYLGSDFSMESPNFQIFKTYWEQELVGRGMPGMFGGFGDKAPEAIQLKAAGDDGLYLKYQEMLVRVLAFCFGLKPQDFGLERDVNRSQGEVSQSASIREAAKPLAMLIERKFNQRTIPLISKAANDPKILDYKFCWDDLEYEDEQFELLKRRAEMQDDLKTLDEGRAEIGLEPMPNGLGELTLSAYRELIKIDPQAGQENPIDVTPAKPEPAPLPFGVPPRQQLQQQLLQGLSGEIEFID